MKDEIDFSALQEFIFSQKSTSDNSVHGMNHWNQVEFNGLFLSRKTGADITVVRLFALFHDSRRLCDTHDPEHGPRGAELAKTVHGKLYQLDDERFDLLYRACAGHTREHRSGNVTIDTCYDSDRLDLGRVGIPLDPTKMATDFGRKIAQHSLDQKISVYKMREWIRSLKF